VARPYRVALLQLRAFDLNQHQAAWNDLLRRVDQALEAEPDLLVLPAASYPAAMITSREAYDAAGVRPDDEVLEALGERSRTSGIPIAAGLVLRGFGGAPRHAAVLIARSGLVAARATERNTAPWFVPGEGPVPVAAAGMPAMLVAGDDLGDPRAAAAIVETGAQLIIHCGASTSSGRDVARPLPAIDEAMLAARAAECGAWVVSASKSGLEAGALLYAGGAGVVDPSGEWVIRAPAGQPGVVQHELDLEAAPGAPVQRRLEMPPTEPARADVPGAAPARVAAIAMDAPASAVDLIETARRLVAAAAAQGAQVVVMPDLAGADPRSVSQVETLPLLESLSEQMGLVLTVGLAERVEGRTYKTVYAIDGGSVVASQRQLHLTASEQAAGFLAGDDPPGAVQSSAGTLGLIGGSDGLVPDIGAVLQAAGAGLLAWSAGGLDAPVEALSRTRAYEQRLPVAAAGGTSERSGATIAAPGGVLIARSPAGETMVVHA
jgi:predicted amidohydrolase